MKCQSKSKKSVLEISEFDILNLKLLKYRVIMEIEENTALLLGLAPVLLIAGAYVVHIIRESRRVSMKKGYSESEENLRQ